MSLRTASQIFIWDERLLRKSKILLENTNNKSLSAVQSGRKSCRVNLTVLLSFACATRIQALNFFRKVKYKLDSLYNKIRNSILNCYSYIGYFFFIARANTYSSFLVLSCVLTQEHLGYILPFYVTYPVYMSSSNRDWRDQRPQFKFLHCLWPN